MAAHTADDGVAASASLEFLTEELEELLVSYDESGHLFGLSGAGAYFLAEHIVASDWFKRVTG